MFGLKPASHLGRAASGPWRATRRWLERHPRRYRDLGPVVVCQACHAAELLTPELDERLWSESVPCPHCGEGVISRAPLDGHRADGESA